MLVLEVEKVSTGSVVPLLLNSNAPPVKFMAPPPVFALVKALSTKLAPVSCVMVKVPPNEPVKRIAVFDALNGVTDQFGPVDHDTAPLVLLFVYVACARAVPISGKKNTTANKSEVREEGTEDRVGINRIWGEFTKVSKPHSPEIVK